MPRYDELAAQPLRTQPQAKQTSASRAVQAPMPFDSSLAADARESETVTSRCCSDVQVGIEPAAPWAADAALASLLDSVPCGVLLVGPGGELRAVNGWFAEILGREKAELAALGSFDRLVEELAASFAEARAVTARWREQCQRGEACWDQLELVSPERKILERFARPLVDGLGRRIGWMELYRDVTSQKLIEGKLFHTERMVALGQLVSSVAHELSNPLTSILGYAQLLLRRRESAEREPDVQHILQEAERASRIAQNLLQFARGAKPERLAVELNEVVRRSLALRAYELHMEEIEVQLELDAGLPPVLGDAARLQQVLLNLLVNAEQAIQHGRGRGRIRLRTRRASGDRLAIDVIDDGPGIAPESLPRLFDPFFTTKPPGVGTGLGLCIAYGIAQEHGGTVTVESRPACGAMFTVELPAAQAARLPVKSSSHAGPQSLPLGRRTPGRGESRSESVLVIEDEPAVARLIADVLAEDGHRTDVVLDSREGLQRIERKPYALVVCDLRMPHLGGRGLFHELLRRGHPLGQRFVFVTGDVLSPHVAEFLRTSGVPYLAKPFLIDELREVVHRALHSTDARALVAPVFAHQGGASAVAPAGARNAKVGWSRAVRKGPRGH